MMKSTIAVLTCILFAAFADQSAAQAPELLEWRKKVTNAKALEDEAQKREALAGLVREALMSREVRLSGTKSTDQVDPEDNQPAPIVNFDLHLNRKTSYQFRPGSATRSLQSNFGYYFTVHGTPYVVLGPAALDPRSPVFTRMAAEHELFHAQHHVGDPRPIEDRELQTWTEMFVRYFHDIHQFKQRWGPLVAYYEDADPGERRTALDRLAAYYRVPSASADEAERTKLRAAFEEWLGRRKKDAETSSAKLVQDLEKAIFQPTADR
jgi:hypothetical protein